MGGTRHQSPAATAEQGARRKGKEVAVYNSGHGGKEGGNHSFRAISRAHARVPALHAASLHPEKRPIRPHEESQDRG
jgi:hypothetical protein